MLHSSKNTRARSRSSAREAELMRLLPLWPHEVHDRSPAGRRRVVALLRRALRAERRRGLAGHWTYDLSRHAQLLALYRAECENLGKMPGDNELKGPSPAAGHRRP